MRKCVESWKSVPELEKVLEIVSIGEKECLKLRNYVKVCLKLRKYEKVFKKLKNVSKGPFKKYVTL